MPQSKPTSRPPSSLRPSLPPPAPLAPLTALDVEAIRLPLERTMCQRLLALPELAEVARRPLPEPRAIRRELLAKALRLAESMAPELHASAAEVARCFHVQAPIELYQSAGEENAAMHFVENPVLLEVQGRMLSLLDPGSRRALLGHELGHYLAHGPRSPDAGIASLAYSVASSATLSDDVRGLGRLLAMAKELTADRFALLGCQDLAALLRLEMASLTGLSGDALTWDTEIYLEQARSLVEEELAAGAEFAGVTHPEHSLRAYAAWLFSESDVYRKLTGKGSGTRALAEVDALLERCLGLARFDLALTTLDEAPPPELHAGALAACVLVAAADGQLADEELESLEASFGGLVRDARRYFDVDHARARFEELRPIVAALGARQHRALFTLLAHTAIADGALEAAEVACMLDIGERIRAGSLFRRLAGALVERLGAGAAASALAKPPPRSVPPTDALEGLRTYLGVTARQGGGSTTLRRLLRLLGASTLSPALAGTLQRELATAGLHTTADLQVLELDAELRLTCTKAHTVLASTDAPIDASVAGLMRALSRLRERLISGDGRSPSVRLRAARSGRCFDLASLEEARVGQGERVLGAVRAGKGCELVDATLVGSHRVAEELARELLLLSREHLSRLEETGANDLAVGAPLLSGRAGDYFVRGPLVLYPVELESSGRGARSFSLRPNAEREPTANQALLRQLFGKRGFAYPDELAARFDELAAQPSGGLEGMKRELVRVGLVASDLPSALMPLAAGAEAAESAGSNELRLEECAALGFFPQSASDLLQDYDGLLQDLGRGQRSPRELLAIATALCPAEMRATLGEPEVSSPPDSAPLAAVVAADPSQRRVLDEARRHPALVVDGPPGTGKSQVIVNLVADAVARGLSVAVVSEKRAALDVVAARLTDAGLGSSFALVHDVEVDRKALYRRIAERLEAPAENAASAPRVEAARRHQAEVEHALGSRSAWLAAPVDGGGPSLGELHTLEAALADYRVPHPAVLAQLPSAALLELRPRVQRLAEYAALLHPQAPWSRPRASFAGWTPADFQRLDQDFHRAMQAAARWEARIPASLELDVLLAAAPGLDAALALQAAWRDPSGPLWTALLLGKPLPTTELELAELTRGWQEGHPDLVRYQERVFLELSADESRALTVGRRWAGSFWRFLSPAWWSVRASLRELAARHGRVDISLQTIRELSDRMRHTQAWNRLEAAFVRMAPRHLLPQRAESVPRLLEDLGRSLPRLRTLLAQQPQLSALGAWPMLPPAGSQALLEHAESCMMQWRDHVRNVHASLPAAEHYLQASEPPARVLPWLGARPRAADLDTIRTLLLQDAGRLAELDALLNAARPLWPPLLELTHALAAHAKPGSWSDAFMASWANASRQAREQHDPQLRVFDAGTPFGAEADAAKALELAEQEVVEQTRLVVRAKLDEAPLRAVSDAAKGARRSDLQKVREAMLKEGRKQRQLMPLRSFTRSYARQGLLDLLPVWFLSPETLSVLFDREPVFDLVIVDEASQVPVENGLPTLLRGKRVVIAGDDKQMPPTSFFVANHDDRDEPLEGADDDTDLEARDAFSSESLLTLARARCPHRGLAWHYRCLDEDLIAFSNHALYGASLLTIPSSSTGSSAPCMRWEAVEGSFVKGRNAEEATRVVEMLAELLARADKPSLGVVTFNVQQKQAILDAIDARRAADASFASLFDAASTAERLDDRPFVKNLENVQGDERDVIVFSPAYAPVSRVLKGGQTVKTVPARFGPLGLRGGERRLNVAISRAKRETIVVCSFDPELLSVAKTRNPGPRLFKEYLLFVRHAATGQRAQARQVLERVVDEELVAPRPLDARRPLAGYVPLAVQIGEALQQAGLGWQSDVGQSEFRIPLAVLDPRDPRRFAVAVLTDEGREPELEPLERWVHRARVLRARGWKVVFVHAREWLLGRDAVLARIRAALDSL